MDLARGSSVLVLLLVAMGAIVVWSAVSGRLERWRVSAPMLMVASGIGAGLLIGDSLSSELDTEEAERVVELILALLLFLDATQVRGGFFAGERSTVVRLLVVAFPLSLALAVVLGVPLLDASSWPVLLAVACVVMPIDFAPAPSLLRARGVRRGVRHALAVESGYNDGIASPLFALALLLLAGAAGETDPASIPQIAVVGAFVAVLVGGSVGLAAALLVRGADRYGWSSMMGTRIVVVIIPLLAYEVSAHLEGNGFIAAFLAGIAYKLGRGGRRGMHGELPHRELATAEDVGAIVSMVMWVVLGAVLVLAAQAAPPLTWILFALLALTLVRMVPVWLATIGSHLSWRERTVLGLYAPRGTSSIVFGLLAFNGMREDDANMTLTITAIVVFLSVMLHGVVLPIASRGRPGT